MAVLIEALSVVIRIETIADKYPGGVEQYIDDCPNNTLCLDDDLDRVGFMTGHDLFYFIGSLERLGFKHINDDEFDEIAVVDQFDGIVRPCSWLEYLNLVTLREILGYRSARSREAPSTAWPFHRGGFTRTPLVKRTLHLIQRSLMGA